MIRIKYSSISIICVLQWHEIRGDTVKPIPCSSPTVPLPVKHLCPTICTPPFIPNTCILSVHYTILSNPYTPLSMQWLTKNYTHIYTYFLHHHLYSAYSLLSILNCLHSTAYTNGLSHTIYTPLSILTAYTPSNPTTVFTSHTPMLIPCYSVKADSNGDQSSESVWAPKEQDSCLQGFQSLIFKTPSWYPGASLSLEEMEHPSWLAPDRLTIVLAPHLLINTAASRPCFAFLFILVFRQAFLM